MAYGRGVQYISELIAIAIWLVMYVYKLRNILH